jgi:MFS family permease
VASIFATILGFVYDPTQFTVVLWFLLFFGGSLVPTATGIVVSSVPKNQQNASSSLGQLIYNIFGFFLAPNVSGLIMDSFDNQVEGLIVGFRFILWENAFSIIFLFIALFFATRRLRSKEKHARFENEVEMADVGGTNSRVGAVVADKPKANEDGEDYTNEEIKKEIFRKRLLSHGSLFD